jgi:hypothetical protein
MQSTFSRLTWLLGALLAAPTVISILQHSMKPTLAGEFAQALNFYRELLKPFFQVLYYPVRAIIQACHLSWSIPQWLSDLHMASFLSVGIIGRGIFMLKAAEKRPERYTHTFKDGTTQELSTSGQDFIAVLFLAFLGLVFAGVPLLLMLPWSMWLSITNSKKDVSFTSVGLTAWATLAAVSLFYLANQYALAHSK